MGSTKPFERLLQAAGAQPEPPRLLFVFAGSDDATDAPDTEHVGVGPCGTALKPLACVDKDPQEITSFDDLAQVPRRPWGAVVIGALSGRDGRAPAASRVEYALKAMVDNVRDGRFAGYIVLDQGGTPLRLS